MDRDSARLLLAGILKQASIDYIKTDQCKEFCERYDICDAKHIDENHCSAKQFLHSTWALQICDELNIDYENYAEFLIDASNITNHVFKFLEGEIRAFRDHEKELQQLRYNILNQTSARGNGRGQEISDSTLKKTIEIMDNNRIIRLEKIVTAIHDIYMSCSDEKKYFVREYYWENRFTINGIAKMMGIDRKTIYRWRKKIVYALAVKLGYL